MSRRAAGKPRLLIVCVDRDNDVGEKSGATTPVIGREGCLSAATALAVSDPEEADANAIFAAVKQHDELKAKGYPCEVAVVAGLPQGGIEADQKMREELQEVTSVFEASGVVLVTDGVEDEKILPILQGVLPVVSVHRIIVKHSRSVEESYAVLGRYLRMLVFEPRYSRWFLGVPGLILLLSGPLIYFNLLREASAILAVMLGTAFVVRAFSIDRLAVSLTKLRPSGYIRLFSIVASILIVVAAFMPAYGRVSITREFAEFSVKPELFMQYGSYLVGLFLSESINFLWIGLGVYFAGNFLYHFVRGSLRILRDALGIVILALLYFPFLQFALILQGVGSTPVLISLLVFGLSVTFLVVGLLYRYVRVRRRARAGS